MPPVNDEYASATPISGASGSIAYDCTTATPDSVNEPYWNYGQSVWFRWTAAIDGFAVFTASDTDNVVAMYNNHGNNPNFRTLVGFGDAYGDSFAGINTSNPSNRNPSVSSGAWVKAGRVYDIVVDSSMAGTLSWSQTAATGPPDFPPAVTDMLELVAGAPKATDNTAARGDILGTGTNARFDQISCTRLAQDGAAIIVMDHNNRKLKRVTFDGVVTTIATIPDTLVIRSFEVMDAEYWLNIGWGATGYMYAINIANPSITRTWALGAIPDDGGVQSLIRTPDGANTCWGVTATHGYRFLVSSVGVTQLTTVEHLANWGPSLGEGAIWYYVNRVGGDDKIYSGPDGGVARLNPTDSTVDAWALAGNLYASTGSNTSFLGFQAYALAYDAGSDRLVWWGRDPYWDQDAENASYWGMFELPNYRTSLLTNNDQPNRLARQASDERTTSGGNWTFGDTGTIAPDGYMYFSFDHRLFRFPIGIKPNLDVAPDSTNVAFR